MHTIKTLFPVPLPVDIVRYILELAWNGCHLSTANLPCDKVLPNDDSCWELGLFQFTEAYYTERPDTWYRCGQHIPKKIKRL